MLAQVGEHVFDQPVRLGTLIAGLVALVDRVEGKAGRADHAHQRSGGDHGEPLLPSRCIALDQAVEIDVSEAGNQFELGQLPAIAFRPDIGCDGFGCSVGRFSVLVVDQQGGREVVRWLALDDDGEDPAVAVQPFVEIDLARDPRGLRGARRAQDDQGIAGADRLLDRFAEVVRSRKFVAILEDRLEALATLRSWALIG